MIIITRTVTGDLIPVMTDILRGGVLLATSNMVERCDRFLYIIIVY